MIITSAVSNNADIFMMSKSIVTQNTIRRDYTRL